MTEQARKEKFMCLYEPVHLSFQRFCRVRARSEDDAKDLVSETILIAYQGLHQLRDDQAFLGFIFGIATRVLKKQYRRQKIWSLFQSQRSAFMATDTRTPDRDLDVTFLYEAIHKLPVLYQDAIVLHCISGFSLQEVAVIQESTVSAVKVRVMRAKIKLKILLRIVDSQAIITENELSVKQQNSL